MSDLLHFRGLRGDPPTRLVVVGHAAWAQHFWVDALNIGASKTQASRHLSLIGGMGANAAVAGARLGASVRLISRVGDDEAADAVFASLRDHGVDTSGVMRLQGRATSQSSVVIDPQGERWIVSHRGSAIAQDPPELDVSLLAGADVILVDPRWRAGALAGLTWARQNGVIGVLDGDVCPQAILADLVAQSQWAAFSLAGLGAFVGGEPLNDDSALSTALQQACAIGAQQALVTLGARGAAWLVDAKADTKALHFTPSLAVVAQDTTGAGDVFHAALAIALAQHHSPERAQTFACVAAALKCAGGAGVLGAPTLAELNQHLSLL